MLPGFNPLNLAGQVVGAMAGHQPDPQAHALVEHCPRNPERTVALRKLLEAKDAAERAVL